MRVSGAPQIPHVNHLFGASPPKATQDMSAFPDSLTHVIADDGGFFVLTCVATAAATKAARRHDCGPLAAITLGRALTGAALLAALL